MRDGEVNQLYPLSFCLYPLAGGGSYLGGATMDHERSRVTNTVVLRFTVVFRTRDLGTAHCFRSASSFDHSSLS